MNDRYSPEVKRAAGMVADQLKCPIERAIVRMHEAADAADRSIGDIACAVLNHSITFGE